MTTILEIFVICVRILFRIGVMTILWRIEWFSSWGHNYCPTTQRRWVWNPIISRKSLKCDGSSRSERLKVFFYYGGLHAKFCLIIMLKFLLDHQIISQFIHFLFNLASEAIHKRTKAYILYSITKPLYKKISHAK